MITTRMMAVDISLLLSVCGFSHQNINGARLSDIVNT
jgi:hypothetical protein